MKKIAIIASAVLFSLGLAAQTTTEEYAKKMNLLVSKVGSSGVGVETLLNKWEADFPEDTTMLVYKFNYAFEKSQSYQVVTKDQSRYLGQKPLMSLKDSLGNDVYYFQELMFDDALFADATQTIDKLIRLKPDDLDLRIFKITSLISYEKESPDMASSALKGLIDYNYSDNPSWTLDGRKVDSQAFSGAIQDICGTLYSIGSPAGYEAFKSVSEKMLSYNPKSANFTSNIGSYYFVYKQDFPQALKYYNKALKLKPDDMFTIRNCIVLTRKEKNTKMEKKYLEMMVRYSQDEIEKESAQKRLEMFK